jgi:hypothetical protein
MQTTTATYKIDVTTETGDVLTYMRTMPTRPKTTHGRIAQINKVEKWIMKVTYKPTKINIQLQK